MSEIVDLNTVEWKPCLRKFVHLNDYQGSWKPFSKLVDSSERICKQYYFDI